MTHPRKTIRDKAVSILVAADTDVLANVFPNRVRPFLSTSWTDDLPAICVYTMDESSQIFDESPRRYKRIVQLAVEIQAKADESVDDVLDAIARQVENALLADETLDATVDDLILSESRTAIRDEGEQLIGATLLRFDATYYDYLPDGGNAGMDDLEEMRVEYSLGGEQDNSADRAKTVIDGLEL
jgi:hypothetical protein